MFLKVNVLLNFKAIITKKNIVNASVLLVLAGAVLYSQRDNVLPDNGVGKVDAKDWVYIGPMYRMIDNGSEGEFSVDYNSLSTSDSDNTTAYAYQAKVENVKMKFQDFPTTKSLLLNVNGHCNQDFAVITQTIYYDADRTYLGISQDYQTIPFRNGSPFAITKWHVCDAAKNEKPDKSGNIPGD